MNAKKCKALRRDLRTNPYYETLTTYVEGKKGERIILIPQTQPDGTLKEIEVPFTITGTIRMNQKSLRYIYKLLKKTY